MTGIYFGKDGSRIYPSSANYFDMSAESRRQYNEDKESGAFAYHKKLDPPTVIEPPVIINPEIKPIHKPFPNVINPDSTPKPKKNFWENNFF